MLAVARQEGWSKRLVIRALQSTTTRCLTTRPENNFSAKPFVGSPRRLQEQREPWQGRSDGRPGRSGQSYVPQDFMVGNDYRKPTARGWGKAPVTINVKPRQKWSRGPLAESEEVSEPQEGRDVISKHRNAREQLKRFQLLPAIPSTFKPYHTSMFIRDNLRQLPKLTKKNAKAIPDLLDSLEYLITTAPKSAVNVVVWNNLLTAAGSAMMYSRMFRMFNDMKKRGIVPSVRTYTIVLQNYSHTKAENSGKQISRATLIFDQYQRYVQSLLSSASEGSESLEGLEQDEEIPGRKAAADGLPDKPAGKSTSLVYIAPTNAYLGQACHFGNHEEMMRVFTSMPSEGPLAPDEITYTTLFRGALEQSYNHVRMAGDQNEDAPISASEIWTRLESQLKQGQAQTQTPEASPARKPQARGPKEVTVPEQKNQIKIDIQLATIAIKALTAEGGRSIDIALQLVQDLFGLSRPGRAASIVMPKSPTAASGLSVIQHNDFAREAIIKLASAARQSPGLAVHYVDQFLEHPLFWQECSTKTVNLILRSLADAKVPARAIEVLHQGSAFGRRGIVDRDSYVWALRSASNAMDFEAMIVILRMMLDLPEGIETGGRDTGQGGTNPGETRSTRVPRYKNGALSLDSTSILLLIETAERTESLNKMRQAMRILASTWDHEVIGWKTAIIREGSAHVTEDNMREMRSAGFQERDRVMRRKALSAVARIAHKVMQTDQASPVTRAGKNAEKQVLWVEIARECSVELSKMTRMEPKTTSSNSTFEKVTHDLGVHIGPSRDNAGSARPMTEGLRASGEPKVTADAGYPTRAVQHGYSHKTTSQRPQRSSPSHYPNRDSFRSFCSLPRCSRPPPISTIVPSPGFGTAPCEKYAKSSADLCSKWGGGTGHQYDVGADVLQPLQSGFPPILLLAFPLAAALAYFSLSSDGPTIEPHRYQAFTVTHVEDLSNAVKLVEVRLTDAKSRKLFTTSEEDQSWRDLEGGGIRKTPEDTDHHEQMTGGLGAGIGAGDIQINHVYIKSPDLQIERPYTPINDVAEEGKMVLLVKRVKGGEVGRYIHTLREGSILEIRGPVATCVVPLSSFDHIDMISTGTGGAPCAQLLAKLKTRAKRLTGNASETSTIPSVGPSIRWTQYVSRDANIAFARDFPVRQPGSLSDQSRTTSAIEQTSSVIARSGKDFGFNESAFKALGIRAELRRAWPDEVPDRRILGNGDGAPAIDGSGVMLCLPPRMTTAWAGPRMPEGRPPRPPPIRGVLGEMGYTTADVLVL